MSAREEVDISGCRFGLDEMWVENEQQFNEALQRCLDQTFNCTLPDGTPWVIKPVEQKDGQPYAFTEKGAVYLLCGAGGLASEAHAWTECLRILGYLIDQAQAMNKTQLLWRRRPEVRGDQYFRSRAGKWSYSMRLAFE